LPTFQAQKILSNFQFEAYVMISKNRGCFFKNNFIFDEEFFLLKILMSLRKKRKKTILAQKKTFFPQKSHTKRFKVHYSHFQKSFRKNFFPHQKILVPFFSNFLKGSL